MPLPAPLGGREAYVDQIARMLVSARAPMLIGPAGMADWMPQIAAATPLTFAGTLADLPQATGAALPAISPEDACYLQFSSGSTRFPTGVLVTHRALMANAVAITRHGLLVRPDNRDQPVAFVMVRPVEARLYVEQIDVLPAVERRGIGAGLLAAVGARALAGGLQGLSLSTFREVPWNAPYYRRLGFVDLADEALTPGLQAIRREHIARGLDEDARGDLP